MKISRIALSFLGLSFCALLALAFTGPGQVIKAEKEASSITYRAHHTLHSWDGTSKKVECAIVIDPTTHAIQKVAAATQVASFDSENASRDSHALEVLEALKYPKVSFISTSVIQKDSVLSISGNLTFHGVTKPLSFTATRKEKGAETTVHGSFEVSLTEFGVERPSFMMVQTDDKLELELNMVFKL